MASSYEWFQTGNSAISSDVWEKWRQHPLAEDTNLKIWKSLIKFKNSKTKKLKKKTNIENRKKLKIEKCKK